jgi:hypothetical protein
MRCPYHAPKVPSTDTRTEPRGRLGFSEWCPSRERRFGFVASFQDGRVIRLEVFVDPAKALEAAGLGE